MVVKMGAEKIVALSDTRLAANQVTGEFVAKDRRMEKYIKAVQQITSLLKSFTIKQILRGSNRRADALSKLASMCFGHLSKEVLVEVLKERSIDERRVNSLSTAQPTGITLVIYYLQHDILPDDHGEPQKTRIQATQYVILAEHYIEEATQLRGSNAYITSQETKPSKKLMRGQLDPTRGQGDLQAKYYTWDSIGQTYIRTPPN